MAIYDDDDGDGSNSGSVYIYALDRTLIKKIIAFNAFNCQDFFLLDGVWQCPRNILLWEQIGITMRMELLLSPYIYLLVMEILHRIAVRTRIVPFFSFFNCLAFYFINH